MQTTIEHQVIAKKERITTLIHELASKSGRTSFIPSGGKGKDDFDKNFGKDWDKGWSKDGGPAVLPASPVNAATDV